jgi:hypothetical protein
MIALEDRFLSLPSRRMTHFPKTPRQQALEELSRTTGARIRHHPRGNESPPNRENSYSAYGRGNKSCSLTRAIPADSLTNERGKKRSRNAEQPVIMNPAVCSDPVRGDAPISPQQARSRQSPLSPCCPPRRASEVSGHQCAEYASKRTRRRDLRRPPQPPPQRICPMSSHSPGARSRGRN